MAATTHQNDVQKASFLIFRLLSLSRKENHARYLSHTTVRVGLKDLPPQSFSIYFLFVFSL